MGGKPKERLSWKEPLHSLGVELERDYGLSPVQGKALVRRIGEILDSYVDGEAGARMPGQVSYSAVALGEPAGKPLRYCLTVPVTLTMLHAEDARVQEEDGSPALRQARLVRMCEEAYRQGGAVSHEDLSLLLAVDPSTVRRMVAASAGAGLRPPTRGSVEDIGPTLSHKEQVVALYFAGHLPQGIASRVGHSLGSVERYLADFARVAHLHEKGIPVEGVVRVTALTPRLVTSYLGLLARYNEPAHRPVLTQLLSRFGPLEGEEVGHG